MDPRDLDFPMRSGGGNLPADPNDVLTIMALTSAFADQAMRDAAAYAQATHRTEVNEQDVVMAMKYNVVGGNGGFLALPDLQERVASWRERLLRDDSSSESDQDSSHDSGEDAPSDLTQGSETDLSRGPLEEDGGAHDVDIIHNVSPDDLAFVHGMQQAEIMWESWVPSTDMERIVHRAIVRAEP